MTKATHKSKKTGKGVVVKRFEGGILVVYNILGKPLNSYERDETKKFHAKYESLVAKKQKE